MINKILAEKIKKLVDADQKARKAYLKNPNNKKLSKQVWNADSNSIKEAKKIIKQYGWPTFDLIGKIGSKNFWLLIQHCDRDIIFQKECLELFRQEVKNGQADSKYFAYLTDRVLRADGKKQKFGTQFLIKNNKIALAPTIDLKNINKRRLSHGLDTIKENTDRMNKVYKSFLKKKIKK